VVAPEEEVFIALGSNLGDRAAFLRQAIERMKETPDFSVEAVSTVMETRPVGPIPQPDYLNAVVRAKTKLPPLRLLERLLAIERELGRTRRERWGPRTIDLDILYYGDRQVNEPSLQVPHPEIGNRPFLLAGLRELGKNP
jgi:2-amino-4-hydroxy-6-hydroxymethyldihydropteridine diphosphokinase